MITAFDASRKPSSLLTASLLVAILASSIFVCLFVNGVSGASLENAIHVKNEKDLRDAINKASSKGVIITLDNDITLSDKLVIPANKDITLTSSIVFGYCKLIGAEKRSTVFVDDKGVLRLDGVIVTHSNHNGPILGGGVYVAEGGLFIMFGGEVSGNAACDVGDPNFSGSAGGGVYNLGVFELYGGKISNNHVSTTGSSGAPGGGCGGGVDNGGTFIMSGGEITNNRASVAGGGVSNYGMFAMSGGMVSSNVAGYWGGGVCNYGVFERLGGVISGNTIIDGGDSNIHPDVGGSGGSPGGDGGSSNGGNNQTPDNNGSGDGGSSNGDNGLFNGDDGRFVGVFSLRDVVFLCVGVALVVVGVVVAVLLFSSKKT